MLLSALMYCQCKTTLEKAFFISAYLQLVNTVACLGAMYDLNKSLAQQNAQKKTMMMKMMMKMIMTTII